MVYNTLKVEFELNSKNEYEIKSIYPHIDFYSIKEDLTLFVNDLDKLYIYIIAELLKIGYANSNDKLENKTFSFVYKNGNCLNLKLKKQNGINIYFINFKSKFGIDFSDEKTNTELIHYAIEKGRLKNSLGADAFNEFIELYLNNKYNANAKYQIIRKKDQYPIFEYSQEMLEAKENVSGFQMCQSGDFNNLIEYDLESSFPSQLFCDTPKGLPKIYYNIEDVPNSYFKIITFSFFNAELKQDKIAFLNISIMGEISLTENLFNLFKENYNATIKIKKITAFKTQKSPFKEFITQNIINGKKYEKRKHIAKYNKYIGNSIIGFFGRNTKTQENTAKLNDLGIVTGKVEKNIDPVYLPVYLSVLDKAKTLFIKTLQRYKNIIVYANTDGFLATQPINLNILNINNSLPIGNYREKNTYKKIYIECINGYVGERTDGAVENTISGMAIDGTIDIEQYRNRNFSYYVNEATDKGTIRRSKIVKV